MVDVKSMCEHSNNGCLRSPVEALDSAKEEYSLGNIKGKKVLILCLDDDEDQYSVSFIQAGMKMSQCVSLCEIAKDLFKEEMGY